MAFNMSLRRLWSSILSTSIILSIVIPSTAAGSSFFRNRLSASPSYRNRRTCPARCSESGPSSSNWQVYRAIDEFSTCDETIFYDFALSDRVDDSETNHRVYACSSYGSDWGNLPADPTGEAPKPWSSSENATYQIGSWPNESGLSVGAYSATIIPQIRAYISNGFAPVKGPTILIASMGRASVGLWIGEGLQNQGIGDFALKALQNALSTQDYSNVAQIAMQYCLPHQSSDHTFGFIATGNGTFGVIQDTLQEWADGKCLTFPAVSEIVGPAVFNTRPFDPIQALSDNSTRSAGAAPFLNSTRLTNTTSTFTTGVASFSNSTRLTKLTSNVASRRSITTLNDSASLSSGGNFRRSDCTTIAVASGDSCASLAQRCGVSGADFTKYNSASNFCATLQPYQHVCCSAGTLPNFAPQTNGDGSCATYTVAANDNCAVIAAKYSLTVDKINSYNTKTWGWQGCSNLWLGTIMCISSGSPPMPAAVKGTVCGPQVPGTAKPGAGVDLASLNPCPLNACCDIFGQCGTTDEFCTVSQSSTGAPGTAQSGQNGCISNCGTKIVRSSAPAVYRNLAFYEGYNLGRPCLYQAASQLDTKSATHIFFSFGVFDDNYSISVGDNLSNYEFEGFKRLPGIKRILSIGGWTFSTDPSTYHLFRNGVLPANRQALANNIASFVNTHGLDGVNIDWEYPGANPQHLVKWAQDMPGIPAASLDDGANYLELLKLLRGLMPDKEISVAAPASYWYLKGFPIKLMSDYCDYIVYMTYDLHGQWDSNNQWSQIGCPAGNCLRTDVNLTETIGTLSMITKAGVPSNKVIVGVTSYGRSFAMSQAGCSGPSCTFEGTAVDSKATPGRCTGTGGYLSNAEILEIIADRRRSGRVNLNYVDSNSHTNILVYDDTQWVGWMDDDVKASRTNLYKSFMFGGTADWATDLRTYNPPPGRSESWKSYISAVQRNVDPNGAQSTTGNWTTIDCTNPVVADPRSYTPSERWAALDCSNAFQDAVDIWKKKDRGKTGFNFTQSVGITFHGPDSEECGSHDGCGDFLTCDTFRGPGTGAAAYEVWNSMVLLNKVYSRYRDALIGAAATVIDNSMATFESTFAPVPPPDPTQTMIEQIVAIVTLGASFAAAPFFNSVFKAVPWGKANPNTLGIFKDDTSGLITFGSNMAKAYMKATEPAEWNLAKQNAFTKYLGDVIHGWAAANDIALRHLFDGQDEGIDALTAAIQDGHLISGSGGAIAKTFMDKLQFNLEDDITKAFYGMAIPAVWYAAGNAAFIINSGYRCGVVDPLGDYLDTDTMHKTAVCVDGDLFYIGSPQGVATNCNAASPLHQQCDNTKFSIPPGLTKLDGNDWGKLKYEEIVTGSVKTWKTNGHQNGGGPPDVSNTGSLMDLANQDLTTPGFFRLPVCSPAMAFTAWNSPKRVDKTDPNYPCVRLPGISDCWDFTFEDDTTGNSPPIADCQRIVDNIVGTDGEWHTGIGPFKQLVSNGLCAVGTQNDGVNGPVVYHTGDDDLVNIILESAKRFGKDGRVGAKGTMRCRGNVGNQPVKWSLYGLS